MFSFKTNYCFTFTTLLLLSMSPVFANDLRVTELRTEYRVNPLGMDTTSPRLQWKLASEQRGEKQTAYRILVASSQENLDADNGDLWDTGKVDSNRSIQIPYAGKPLTSRMECFWKVKAWDAAGSPGDWSSSSHWSMGLLDEADWRADYISYRDDSKVHADRESLYLPAARQYRKEFAASKEIKRATLYATALGVYELSLNGERVGDAYFAPGWTDYRERAYYNTYDVTDQVLTGENAIGAWVAEGWYSGYVGFGLLTSMGTEKNGRATYGKTPSVMAQLEIEYSDGSREVIVTDSTWKVTGDGPIQEADLLMGEAYDARKEQAGWNKPGFDDSSWQLAIKAIENGDTIAMFYEARNPTRPNEGPSQHGREHNLGFKRPKLEAFPGVPVRVIQEIPAVKVTKRGEGNFIIDLGQNFAGVIRLKVKGNSGHQVQLRYGEMLHPDGSLMTENLRKARAQDFYTCKGNGGVETYQPRFTFHGFQFVELINFPAEADTDTVTGLVMHSDTPLTSTFECSDSMVNQLFKNVVWTQRANFLDLPTDCPQRDERMGWTGDAQAYVATAAYNADISAFYTKWLRELMESQRPSGAFPGYAPFPFQHGWDFGTAWADAGVICPWTIWQAYGDTRVIEECWMPMTQFMKWRKETSKDDLGVSHGNAWGDWLAQGASTPLDFVDTVYFAISARMMADMAAAIGRHAEATAYREQFSRTKTAFIKKYLGEDGGINVNTQSAHALALFADLVPAEMREKTGKRLAELLAKNGNHMSTGFLGTRPLLPVLSSAGQHELATFLLQSHEFPSWGYEIDNGATTIWERWDSYTREDAFGRHNAAMNSFSHYSFGAVCEWMFRTLAGIESDGPGYERIIIRPTPPAPGSNAMHEPIHWVKASYDSIRGTIRSNWKVDNGDFALSVTIPTNTIATIYLPAKDKMDITESGKPIEDSLGVKWLRSEGEHAVLSIESGSYNFLSKHAIKPSDVALRTSVPEDQSINPEGVDVTGAEVIASWDFSKESDVAKWNGLNNVSIKVNSDGSVISGTGPDPQMSTKLAKGVEGSLAIEVRAKPRKGCEMQFFWASPESGFNAGQTNSRPLSATEQVNEYRFHIGNKLLIDKIRLDPLSNEGEIYIESIKLYRL